MIRPGTAIDEMKMLEKTALTTAVHAHVTESYGAVETAGRNQGLPMERQGFRPDLLVPPRARGGPRRLRALIVSEACELEKVEQVILSQHGACPRLSYSRAHDDPPLC